MINEGDRVYIQYIGSNDMLGTVINMPRGVGDLMVVLIDDGRYLSINPYCSDFLGLELVERDNPRRNDARDKE